VLAYDRSSTLWDAARLLSVGEEGYAFRARVASRVRTQPEFKEIAEFFAAELSAQLADSRSTTTAKLDAPVNKLARLLNSPSIKRVLLNDSLRISFDEVIANGEVLVVKGALGSMGAGNTSVLMQLLVGMLDAALARRQDTIAAEQRNAVALKVDEAPLVLNRGFAETMALKRSAGLETVACWQTDSQWVDREVRDQLDALFAHRVYFATSSVEDARNAARLMMAEFSDTVRPGIRNLSALGRPDVRLHLPKHNAIASWVTSQGRQPPFVAQTLPLRVDPARLALHAARQAGRGGRFLEDLSQPHWDRSRDETSPPPRNAATPPAIMTPPGPAVDHTASADRATSMQKPSPPERPAASPPDGYRELVDLAGAHSVRWAKPPARPVAIEPEPLDIEILSLVASLRHVLSSQIHRRFNDGRAATTTQRRLKRLSDADLLTRFQFHRRDGGGAPMCYTISPRGRGLLEERYDHVPASNDDREPAGPGRARGLADARVLAQAHRDVRVTGYVLALERSLAGKPFTLRGPSESVLSSPARSTHNGHAPLTLAELRLPGGRTPHDFLRTDAAGGRVEVERFETIRPDATVVPAKGGRDLMVELDDRLPQGADAAKLERYDHFLAGWSAHVKRYARHGAQLPIVVFVCRDRARARECARGADRILVACRAYPGEYPSDWQYPSRNQVLFAAERDAHEGDLLAYGVPPLPPEVRVAAADGDPRAREATVRECEISCASPAASLSVG
jgi:Replication-relaxation